jgi:hypothetical protein
METGETRKEVFCISWIDTEDIDKLVTELGIKITNETSPTELFDSVKKLIVAAINAVDKDELTENISRGVMREINQR